MAWVVFFPMADSGNFNGTSGNWAVLEKRALTAVFSPGAMATPNIAPSPETVVNVKAVPKSTTIVPAVVPAVGMIVIVGQPVVVVGCPEVVKTPFALIEDCEDASISSNSVSVSAWSTTLSPSAR